MNFALAAVVLFLVVTPGIVLRRAYLSAPFSKRSASTTLTDELLGATIPAVFLHLLAIAAINASLGTTPNLRAVAALLSNDKQQETAYALGEILLEDRWRLLAYWVALLAVATACGAGARRIVLRTRADVRYRWLRYSNEWFYLTTGRGETSAPALILVDALVAQGSLLAIYSGRLDQHFLSRDGGLDSLVLREPFVRQMVKADGTVEETQEIPGQYLVLKYSTIVNLNFSYYLGQE